MLTLDKVMVRTVPIAAAEPLAMGLDKLRRSGRDRLPVSSADGRYVGMLEPTPSPDASSPCADHAIPSEPAMSADAPASLLRLFAEQDSDTIAVVDATGHTLGVADRQLTLKLTAELVGADTAGATIAVGIRKADYEVGRIVSTIEMAGARVLSVTSSADSDTATLYVKIAQQDPFPVIEALERHGYDAATYTGSYSIPSADDVLRRNYDSLMDYLKV